MEAMIEATSRYEQAAAEKRTELNQQIEQARYEVQLARRYYESVDPQNRLVAREVERRYESALAVLEQTQAQVQQRSESLQESLTEQERAQLQHWAQNLHELWHAPTTRPQERKRIARCLFRQVVVQRTDPGDSLDVKVHWSGGQVSTLSVPQAKRGEQHFVTDPDIVEQVRQLAAEFTDSQIAIIMSRKGLRTSKGHPFTSHRIACLRNRYGIEKGPPLPRRGPDIYTAQQASELLGVTRTTVVRWVETGLLRGAQVTGQAPWRIEVTAGDRERLATTQEQPGWLTLKAAAAKLGVSQQAILQKVNTGQLEGTRVQMGARASWRIRVISGLNDTQSQLFD